MTKISRTTRLIVTARAAARGATSQIREQMIAVMTTLPLPKPEQCGKEKRECAHRLKEWVERLKGLEGEARTKVADRVVEIAGELVRLPDDPHADEDRETPYYLKD